MSKSASSAPAKLTAAQLTAIQQGFFNLTETTLSEYKVTHPEDPGFFLVGVVFEKQAGHWVLQIFVDRPDFGISLDDCEKVSRLLDPAFDVWTASGQIQELKDLSYTLEVSSPGLFRALKTARELAFYCNQPVRVEQAPSESGKAKKPEKTPRPKGPYTLQAASTGNTPVASGTLKSYHTDSNTLEVETIDKNGNPQIQQIPLTPDIHVFLNPTIKLDSET